MELTTNDMAEVMAEFDRLQEQVNSMERQRQHQRQPLQEMRCADQTQQLSILKEAVQTVENGLCALFPRIALGTLTASFVEPSLCVRWSEMLRRAINVFPDPPSSQPIAKVSCTACPFLEEYLYRALS